MEVITWNLRDGDLCNEALQITGLHLTAERLTGQSIATQITIPGHISKQCMDRLPYADIR